MPSRPDFIKTLRSLLFIALVASLCAVPLRVVAQDDDDDNERGGRAGSFARAGDEEDLNRELWEHVKGTPYAGVLAYVEAAQARAQAARVAEAVLPTGWKLAPAGGPDHLGPSPYEAGPFRAPA